jgi:hypothetical protein
MSDLVADHDPALDLEDAFGEPPAPRSAADEPFRLDGERCERSPLCTRGYRHHGKGGLCSYSGRSGLSARPNHRSSRPRTWPADAAADGGLLDAPRGEASEAHADAQPGGGSERATTADSVSKPAKSEPKGEIIDCRKRGRGVQYLVRLRSTGASRWFASRDLARFPEVCDHPMGPHPHQTPHGTPPSPRVTSHASLRCATTPWDPTHTIHPMGPHPRLA